MLKNQIDLLISEAEAAYHKQLNNIKDILGHLHHKDPRRQQVRQVLTTFFNNQTFIIMSVTIEQTLQAPIVLTLVDAKTLASITATKANEKEVSDNPAVAAVDASGNLQGIAPGTFNLISDADWTYTDSNTNQQVTTHETTTTPGTVTAVITAEGVQQVVSLGTPVAIPAPVVAAPAAAAAAPAQ